MMETNKTVVDSASVMTTEEREDSKNLDWIKNKDKNRPMSGVSMWRVLGKRVPREELVFGCQMIVVFAVVVASIYNLSTDSGGRSELWTALLSSCLGYILPNPRLKRN